TKRLLLFILILNLLGAIALWGEEEPANPLFFPRLNVPKKALKFSDPAIASLAGRIADGSADLRDRRDWYLFSLEYAPFTALPPLHWREKALQAGEKISLASRRKEQLTRGVVRGEPDAILSTYTWNTLGPTDYTEGGTLDQGRGTALWVHP